MSDSKLLYGRDCDGNPMPPQRNPEAAFKAILTDIGKAFTSDKQDECSLNIEKLKRAHQKYYHCKPSEPMIEFKKPSELASFEPPDGWNMVGNHHIQRGAPFVIAGAPGCGKSRVLTALAIAGATGHGWMGLPVHAQFKTMFIQGEKGPVRLADELRDITRPEFDDWIRITPPPPHGFAFDNPVFCRELRDQIAEFEPDIVAVDPWNRVAADDKGRDYKEAFEKLLGILP
ncbi:MAG: AAA family ATPase, partial [Verrucomicrobiales bacterium]